MNELEVKELMMTSKSEQEWNTNCDKVKKACGDYPIFWYTLMISSGLMSSIVNSWVK